MNIINVQNLTMSFGPKIIFDDVDFAIDEGEKVALMGPNGVGKTTLFRILTGRYQPDDGIIALRNEARIGHLTQDTQLDPQATPRELVARAVDQVRELIARYDAVSKRMTNPAVQADQSALQAALGEQEDLRRRIEAAGGWDWERRIAEVLGRLGLSALIDAPAASLSGGQRRRVALARVLLESPDLLLMDEPTNHLDHEAVEWLEGWLKNFPGGVMLITHDRYFLEQVADRIIEATRGGLYSHPGTYREFMDRKLRRIEVEQSTQRRADKSLDAELEWAQRGVKSRGRTSKARAEEIERALEERRWRDQRTLDIPISHGPSMGPHLLSGLGIYKGYMPPDDPINGQKRMVLENISLSIVPGDKIGIVGPNGRGKSTLLKVLVGEERLDAGILEVDPEARLAYLNQDDPIEDAELSVYNAFSDSDYVWIGDTRFHKRDYLGRFLFDNALLKSRVKMLSGGQRRRLRIAEVIAQNANLLVLDEPTNDLDIESIRALEVALSKFKGCILVVSHDRYFLNEVCNSICAFEDGELVRYWGNYDNYVREREQKKSAGNSKRAPTKNARHTKNPPRPKKPTALTWREKKRLESIEAELEQVEEEIAHIEAQLADPALYSERPAEVEPLNRRHHDLNAKLNTLFDEWQDLENRR